MDPHPGFLPQTDAARRETLDRFADTVDQTVNFGTHLAAWLLSPEPVHETRLVIVLLFRQLLEIMDGVSAVLRRGCDEPCRVLLRSAFEAHLGLTYITQEDSERRGLAYRVSDTHRRLTYCRRLDPKTQDGRQAQAAIARDTSGFAISPEGLDTAEAVSGLEDNLRHPNLLPIEEEWQRTKRDNGNRTPNWFSLFDGPKSIEDLARVLGHGAWYERLYRDWSPSVHASNALRRLEVADDGRGAIAPLRHPEDLQLFGGLAVSMMLKAEITLITRLLPERLPDFRSWYISEVDANYQAMGGEEELLTVRREG